MSKILLLLAIYLLFFFGCSPKRSNKSEKTIIGLDQVHDTLYGEVLTFPLLSKTPIAIYYSPFGLIAVPAFQDGVVQLIDTASGKTILSQFTRGKAPEELLNPMGMDFNTENSTFCMWDLGKQSINLYKVSEKGFQHFRTNSYSVINPSIIRNITDSLDVILTSIPNQSLMLHNQMGVINALPYQILPDAGLDYFNYYYPSEIDVCTKSELIFTADPYLPYVATFSYKDFKIVKLWDKMLFQPDYSIRKRWRYINEESCLGFDCISVSNKYIYLTYSGVNRAQWDRDVHKKLDSIYLIILDFDGNIVSTFLLDHNLDYFTVTPDDRVLYGLIERPDRFIVKYILK